MERFTITTIAILLFASITKAQITKGSLYLGGSIGFSSNKLEPNNSSIEGKSKSFSINPAVGIAVKNNLLAGVNLNYGHGSTKGFQSNQDYKSTSYGAGVFLRKYWSVFNRLYFFGQSDLGYSHSNYKYLPTAGYSYDYTTKHRVVSANLFPGISINVLKSFYLETVFNDLLNIAYSNTKTNGTYNGVSSSSKQTSFSIGSNLTNSYGFNIGVRFIIPKK
jgi:hypothetical protein